MPLYEYQCEACGKTTEALRSMSAADDPIACEHCESTKTRRAHSVFAATTGGREAAPMPMGGCGRCGDPNGSCSLN